jgi:excisionase family DNA binding protein
MPNASKPLTSVSRNAFHHSQLLMSVADAMRSLAVGRTKFYELVAAHEIELVKIGSKSCAVVASVKDYVDRLRAQAGEKPLDERPGPDGRGPAFRCARPAARGLP